MCLDLAQSFHDRRRHRAETTVTSDRSESNGRRYDHAKLPWQAGRLWLWDFPLRLGSILYEGGEHDRARSVFAELKQQWGTEIANYMKQKPHETRIWRPNLNAYAWFLVTCPIKKLQDPAGAVQAARYAITNCGGKGSSNLWNTLGVAQYRNGDWKAAIAALQKSMQLQNGGNSVDWFFLAMSHWQLGDRSEARQWYVKANDWMKENDSKDDELLRFQAEAEELMGIWRPVEAEKPMMMVNPG